ncbi:MAG TPA: methionine--tRNA ligase subunit beta, partial [Leptospiraceae bacterium]|nr:methionine--tRNA ligase subunit beta [Leptospiraceae bacterium]
MLSKRVDTKAIELMTEESRIKEEPKEQKSAEKKAAEQKPAETKEAGKVSESGFIKIDDLAKVELRVGLITEASAVEGADKLVNVKVDLGEKGIKNVFAGIKAAYSPEELKGMKVVVVANLEPRKMKFGVSEAMLLASGKENTLSLFVPHRNAEPGDLLK